jgi:hypothetical protein
MNNKKYDIPYPIHFACPKKHKGHGSFLNRNISRVDYVNIKF